MNVDMQRGEIIVTELDFDKRRYGGGEECLKCRNIIEKHMGLKIFY